MVLNLDTHFKPLPNQEELNFEHFTFSGGEPHIKIGQIPTNLSEITITTRIICFNDIGLLSLAVNALQHLGIKTINLILPYFPGARQDRLMAPGEALTVKVYADLINALELNRVTIFDPHSDVTPALLKNCNVLNNFAFIETVISKLSKDILLISPDGGALKKIYKLATYLKNYKVVECSKSRNIETGELSAFRVYHDDLEGRDCLIVDDICDGGGTFLGLADELKAKNAGNLHLAVSHGIFNNGLDLLAQKFKTIHTTDSFKTHHSNHLNQISLSSLINN